MWDLTHAAIDMMKGPAKMLYLRHGCVSYPMGGEFRW